MEIATRHSIFCILPPHILIAIAKNAATPEQRAAAVDALSIDHSLRNERQAFSLMGGLQINVLSSASLDAAGQPQKHRTIYDCGNGIALPGKVVRTEEQPAVRTTARSCL